MEVFKKGIRVIWDYTSHYSLCTVMQDSNERSIVLRIDVDAQQEDAGDVITHTDDEESIVLLNTPENYAKTIEKYD